jgi:hypothetical protein
MALLRKAAIGFSNDIKAAILLSNMANETKRTTATFHRMKLMRIKSFVVLLESMGFDALQELIVSISI